MSFLIYIAIAWLLCWLFLKWATNISMKPIIRKIGAVCIVVVVLGYQECISRYGSTQIGSLFERAAYVESYYVHVYADPDTSANQKLPAEIEARVSEDSWQDNDGNDRTAGRREYVIQSAIFPDGSERTFYDELDNSGSDVALQLHNRVKVNDDQQRVWYIELTDERVQ